MKPRLRVEIYGTEGNFKTLFESYLTCRYQKVIIIIIIITTTTTALRNGN